MSEANQEVRCPKCQSPRIHADKRGYSFWIGFIGSGKIVLTCLACGHRFAPGQGLIAPTELPKPSKLMEVDEDDRGIPTYKLD